MKGFFNNGEDFFPRCGGEGKKPEYRIERTGGERSALRYAWTMLALDTLF